MKKIQFLTVFIFTFLFFSLQARVITNEQVRENFILASYDSEIEEAGYELDPDSVKISTAESLLIGAAEFYDSIKGSIDYYEVHADYYKNNQRVHLNAHIKVVEKGILDPDRGTYIYTMKVFDHFMPHASFYIEKGFLDYPIRQNVSMKRTWESEVKLYE